MKSVTSSDPRKKAVVARMKRASGAQKITNVVEKAPGEFCGRALAYVPQTGKYDVIGDITVYLSEPTGVFFPEYTLVRPGCK